MIEGGPDGGRFVGGVLEFNHPQGEPVDEDHHIRPTMMLALHHGELVHRQPVVVLGLLKIHQEDPVALDAAVGEAVLHRHAVHQPPVEGAVVGDQDRGLRPGDLAEGILPGLRRDSGVQPGQGLPQPLLEHHLAVILPLGEELPRGDLRPRANLIPQVLEPGQGGFFHRGFGYFGGHYPGPPATFRHP